MADWDQVKEWGRIFKALIPWLFGLFGIHHWAYNKFPKYYFMLLKIFSKFRDTKWSITTTLVVDIASVASVYSELEKILFQRYSDGHCKRKFNFNNKKMYECGSFIFTITDNSDMGNQKVNIWVNIPQLNVTVNNATNYLRDIRELFHEIELQIKPEETYYNIDIFFPNTFNPFYGLMIQRLGSEKIEYFECRFPISALVKRNYELKNRDNNFLRVYKDKITINETSFDALEETALRALLLE